MRRRTFYPLLPADQPEELGAGPTSAALVLAAPATPATPLVLAVSDPGPGDDVGTLEILDDGTARWQSDSGITALLTADELTYDWVC